jgi:glycosyltransferase involved in cell wall biosynthesis
MHVVGVARNDVRAWRLATALTKANYQVSIADIACDRASRVEENVMGIHVTHLHVSTSFLSERFRRRSFRNAAWVFCRALLWLMQAPADIYHALDLAALPACYIASRLRRKPLIFDAYDMPFETLALSDMTKGRYRLQTLIKPVINHGIAYCAGIIAASPATVQEIKKRYHVSNVSLVRNIPPYQPIVRSDHLRRYLGLEPDRYIALYQGNLQPDRGLDTLVQTARFLDENIIIVIMGKDSLPGTRSRLEALIATERVGDRIKIIPEVPYHELLNWTASADIGLIVFQPKYSLNIQQTLPNKLFEFIMAGVPILASQLDAVVELIRTYSVGQIVTSLSPADIATAIKCMLADHAALASMRRNALDAAKRQLNWENEEEVLIRFYRNIVNGS